MRAAPHRSSADRDATLRWDFLPTTHLKNDAGEEGKQEGREVEETQEKEIRRVRRKDER